MAADIRWTQYASGRGGACKIPPGERAEAARRSWSADGLPSTPWPPLHGRIFEASPDPGARAIKEFNEHVLRDDRVEPVMLAVGDGLTMARAR
jgi:hypothetical protein